MPTLRGRNYQLIELQTLWAPLYEAALDILGTTGVILPIGDPQHGQPDATTFKTVGEEQVTFTWGEAPDSFDVALDLTSPDSYQGIIPILSFNGTDEEADSPDDAYWSRDDTANEGFSLGAWAHIPDDANEKYLMSKWGSAAGTEEWRFGFGSAEKFHLALSDESAGVLCYRSLNSSISRDRWVHVAATYDGGGGATAANGITLYVDGVATASTATNDGGYVGMENDVGLVTLGQYNNSNFFKDKLAGGPCGPFFTQIELTADAVKRLYQLQRIALGV